MTTAKLKYLAYLAFGFCGVFFLYLAGNEAFVHTRHFASNFLTSLILAISGFGFCLFSLATLFLRDDPDIWR